MRNLICPGCSANLSINDTNRDFAFCQFCGAKIMLDDYRITQRIIDEAQIRRIEMEQENRKFETLKTQRNEILKQWDIEQVKEEAEVAKSKKNFNMCLWLCLLGVGIYGIPFFAIKYNRVKKNYENKKKRRDYMRQLPLDKFFQEMEEELQKQREESEKTSFFDTKLW